MKDESIINCIDHCNRCHHECLETAMNYCLERGGEHAQPPHLRLMLACAEICQTAANVMLIGHGVHEHVCRACAKVCDQCADDCERIGDMDSCVEVCRRCAESCRGLSPQ